MMSSSEISIDFKVLEYYTAIHILVNTANMFPLLILMFPREFAHPRGPAVAPRLPKSFDSVPHEAARVPGWHVCTSRPTPHGPGRLKTSRKTYQPLHNQNSQPAPLRSR